MADDLFPAGALPDEARLVARAREAGVDLESLPFLVRRARLRDFRTPDEQAALDSEFKDAMAEDVRLYNERYEKYGIWNAKFRGW